MRRVAIALALAAVPAPVAAQAPVPAAATARPVTIEYYYRIRWGSMDEFLRLYRANHEPILRAMQEAGFITRMETEQPYTHLAGDVRWDLRVTITYRDGAAAVEINGAHDQAATAATRRLFPDRDAHNAAEARRFALIEEHWDVIVAAVNSD
jgi:hypothetical protein